jgi:hypothetical protein
MLDRLGLEDGPVYLAVISANGGAIFLALITSLVLAFSTPRPRLTAPTRLPRSAEPPKHAPGTAALS